MPQPVWGGGSQMTSHQNECHKQFLRIGPRCATHRCPFYAPEGGTHCSGCARDQGGAAPARAPAPSPEAVLQRNMDRVGMVMRAEVDLSVPLTIRTTGIAHFPENGRNWSEMVLSITNTIYNRLRELRVRVNTPIRHYDGRTNQYRGGHAASSNRWEDETIAGVNNILALLSCTEHPENSIHTARLEDVPVDSIGQANVLLLDFANAFYGVRGNRIYAGYNNWFRYMDHPEDIVVTRVGNMVTVEFNTFRGIVT